MCGVITYSLRQVLPGLLVPLNAVDTIKILFKLFSIPKVVSFFTISHKKNIRKIFLYFPFRGMYSLAIIAIYSFRL